MTASIHIGLTTASSGAAIKVVVVLVAADLSILADVAPCRVIDAGASSHLTLILQTHVVVAVGVVVAAFAVGGGGRCCQSMVGRSQSCNLTNLLLFVLLICSCCCCCYPVAR